MWQEEKVLIISYRQWNWDSISLGNLPKVTQLISNKLRFKPNSLDTEPATSATPFCIFSIPQSLQEMERCPPKGPANKQFRTLDMWIGAKTGNLKGQSQTPYSYIFFILLPASFDNCSLVFFILIEYSCFSWASALSILFFFFFFCHRYVKMETSYQGPSGQGQAIGMMKQ